MRVAILTIFSIISIQTFAQDFGYFGKKNTLTVNAILYNPFIYNLFNRGSNSYSKVGSTVGYGKSQLDYGYSAAYSHYFSGSFGLGAEVGMVYGKIVSPENYYYNNNDYLNPVTSEGQFRVEQFKISTLTIMPKLEYTFSGEQLPIGINHQFGLGISTTKLVQQNYNYEIEYFYSSNGSPFQQSLITPYDKVGKFYNLTAMYAFNVRTPITKSLMINYGLKYNANISLSAIKDDLLYSGNGNSDQTVDYIREEIRQKKSTSVLSFNIGLTFVF